MLIKLLILSILIIIIIIVCLCVLIKYRLDDLDIDLELDDEDFEELWIDHEDVNLDDGSINNPTELVQRQIDIVTHNHNLHLITDEEYKRLMDDIDRRAKKMIDEKLTKLEEQVFDDEIR